MNSISKKITVFSGALLLAVGLIALFVGRSADDSVPYAKEVYDSPEKISEKNKKLPESKGGLTESLVQEAFGLGLSEYDSWTAEALMDRQAELLDDAKERRKVLWALCRFDSPAVRNFLAELLKNESENEFLRADILSALMHEDALWVNSMLEELISSESDIIASRAVEALGHFNGDSAIDMLVQLAYEFNLNGAVSMAAAEALGNLGSPEAGHALMELFELGIRSGEDSAIEHALAGLGCLGSAEAEAYLTEVFDLASDPAVRIEIIEALDESENGEYEALTLLALSDKSDDVRSTAAWLLSYQDKVPLSEKEIMNLIAKESDIQVRSYLYQAMDGVEDLDFRQVMPLVKSETDPQVKLSGCMVLCRQLMTADELDHQEIASWLETELVQLKGNELLSKSELMIVDRLMEQTGKR